MNYNKFLIYKEMILKEKPDLINVANNNLYDFFKDFSFINEVNPKDDVYRCHIVEDYLKFFSLPDSLKTHIGASSGVRVSLSLLFKELNNWIIPQDVYPFYIDELSKTQSFFTYQTLTQNSLFNSLPKGKNLLITYPIKPLGRDFNENEWMALFSFLAQDKENKIVIDMVYQTTKNINPKIIELYKTNQVIITHSLSKMFLLPNTFGITLLPQTSEGLNLREKFKVLEKSQAKLKLAHLALNNKKDFPLKLNQKLEQQRKKLEKTFSTKFTNQGYLFYNSNSPAYFLEKGFLVIPESVFGGSGKGSIISALF